jgi:hypothetical protein
MILTEEALKHQLSAKRRTINSFKYVHIFVLLPQAVAMQQMYAQYVNQYMQYLQSAGGHFAAAGIHTWNGAAAGVAHEAVHDPRQVLSQYVLFHCFIAVINVKY